MTVDGVIEDKADITVGVNGMCCSNMAIHFLKPQEDGIELNAIWFQQEAATNCSNDFENKLSRDYTI